MKPLLFPGLLLSLSLFAMRPALAEEGLFEKLDANKDGFVAGDEVGEPHKGLFERLVRHADGNRDGKLDREEFTKGTAPRDREKAAEAGPPAGRPDVANLNPREIFKHLDRDSNGKLSREELPERVREHFASADTNGDGAVSPEEFATAHEKLAQRGGPPGERKGGEILRRAAEIFKSRDANGDGRLVIDEVGAEHQEKFKKLLAMVGKDSVSLEEFARAMARLDGAAASGKPPATSEGATRTPLVPPLVRALDSDANGELSADEISAASKSLARLDKNGDGKLSRDELFMPPPSQSSTRGGPGEYIVERLKAADKDGNGSLSREEAPEFLKERFEKIDANGNGQLESPELKAVGERLKAAGAQAVERLKKGD